MTPNRRRQDLVRSGDRITDEAAMRDWLASMERPRAAVVRLSLTDPVIVAGSKGRAA